jgi:hypothetical protein
MRPMISYGDDSIRARYIVMTRSQGGQNSYEVFDTQAGRAVGKTYKTKAGAEKKAAKLNG